MRQIVCDECGQRHGGIPADDCAVVIRAYAESSAVAAGHSKDFAKAFAKVILKQFPVSGSAFLGIFLEACRYFARRPPPGPEIAGIVHRQAPPFVRDLQAAGEVAEHGESVIYEGRERVWNGEAWETLPDEQQGAVVQ